MCNGAGEHLHDVVMPRADSLMSKRVPGVRDEEEWRRVEQAREELAAGESVGLGAAYQKNFMFLTKT